MPVIATFGMIVDCKYISMCCMKLTYALKGAQHGDGTEVFVYE